MDAWRGEVYVGEYSGQGLPQGPPAILTPEALEERLVGESWALFGDGAAAAVVKAGDKYYKAKTEVKVTKGGCGG